MNFNRRLILSFVAPSLLFVVSLAVGVWALVRTQAEFAHYTESTEIMSSGTRELYAQRLQMGQALRNLMLDPNIAGAKENLTNASQAYDKAYEQVQQAARGTPLEAGFAALEPLRSAHAQAQDKALKALGTDEALVIMMKEEVVTWRKLRAELLKLREAAGQLAQKEHQALNDRVQRMTWLAVGLAAGALLLAVALGVALMRTVRREIGGDPAAARQALRQIADGDLSTATPPAQAPGSLMAALVDMKASLLKTVTQVRQAADGINVASSEIAAGNQDLSARTEQAASNLEETAASMEELTSTVRNSADAARQANQLAASASEVAVRGGQVVGQVVATMQDIHHSSQKINDIIGTIDGIAFQTNILALNAAVEAARAGEQGRGFAVVAAEVRNLAQRSAEAAKEIKGLISDSVDKVDVGTQLVADAGQTMSEIVGSIQRVSDIVGEITAAAGEQSDGIGQVNTAVNQLDQMTQQNAALVEESAAAAQSLKDQAGRLTQVVSTFRIDGAIHGAH